MAKRIRSSKTTMSSESMDKTFKRSDYSEYKPNRASKNSKVWNNFLRRSDGLMALCKLCEDVEPLPKLIPTKDFNTSGLVNHLVSKHQALAVRPKAVETGSESGVGEKGSAKSRITDYFKRDFTVDSLVAELVAKDGISFNTIAKSRPLQRLFNSEFGQLPSSHVTIRRRFMKFGEQIKSEKKKTIEAYIKAGGKYSITLDEWTSGNNRRYLNVNIHDSNSEFVNLGLEPIPDKFTSEDCLQLVEKRLESFGLKLRRDIVGSTNDGANVMKKYGTLSKIINQLCFAHGMHLAVVDTLYKVKNNSPNSEAVPDVIEDSESESEWTDIEDEQSLSETDEPQREQVFSDGYESDCESSSPYDLPISNNLVLQESVTRTALDKIRATSKLFRKSPLKNNFLQKQIVRDRDEIEAARGKKLKGQLNLLLDTRIRWSSILPMAQRYMDIRPSVEKTLVDLKSSLTIAQRKKIVPLTDEEVAAIQNLLEVLGPLKISMDQICAADVNLLSFEEIYSDMASDLRKSGTEFGQKLAQNILDRISQRRTVWSKILYTLHYGIPDSPECSEDDSSSESAPPGTETLRKDLLVDGKVLKKYLLPLLERLVPASEDYPNSDEDVSSFSAKRRRAEPQSQIIDPNLPLLERIKLRKARLLDERSSDEIPELPEKSLKNILQEELQKFKECGKKKKRGHHLSLAYEYLLTIRPTSVQSERSFSIAGMFCTKMRGKLADIVLDMMCFLNAHFTLSKPKK